MTDIAKLVLRLTIGGLMLFHGISKVVHGIAPIKDMIHASGLPSIVAYGVYMGEVVAPILIILGVLTRPAALVFSFNMVVAVLMAHRAQVFTLEPMGGGYALEV